jgi:transcription antitermination factor NusG
MNQSAWSALHVIVNHEKRVAQHLSVRNVEHYLPLYTERSRWTDRTVTLERPLFAGYLFVRYSPEIRLAVISIPGVLRLLGDDDCGGVSDLEISRIREGLAKGYLLLPYPDIPVGTQVRVCHGVFAGAEGIVTDFRQRCKVVLTLSATNQRFSLEADYADIQVQR